MKIGKCINVAQGMRELTPAETNIGWSLKQEWTQKFNANVNQLPCIKGISPEATV